MKKRRLFTPFGMLGMVFVLFALSLFPPGAAQAQGGPSLFPAALDTTFTYQGRLEKGGSPYTGQCDFQFGLWDAASGGTQVGTTLTKTGVGVDEGYFTVELDFGAAPFTGDGRWLEVAARCPAGSGSYTTLGRQALRATPYALYAGAVSWGSITGRPTGLDDGDDDTLAGLSCANGQVAKWNGTAWACSADADSGGDITGVTAGTGLTGGGASGEVSLSLGLPYRLPQSCASGQIAEWNGTAWVCGDDDVGSGGGGDITAVYAGDGLSGGGTSGPVTLTVNFGGNGTATTVARSDHTHDDRYYTESELQTSGQAQVHWGEPDQRTRGAG